MIAVDSAIRRGKWLFKYPWRILGGIMFFYGLPFLLYPYISLEDNWLLILFKGTLKGFSDAPLNAYLGSTWWIFLGYILIPGCIVNISLYFLFFNKWKQWAFGNIDDPKAFVCEAIRQHFYITPEELRYLHRVK